MKIRNFTPGAFSLLTAAVLVQVSHGGVVSLTSPDGKWRLNSDEFGASGGGLPGGGGGFRDFGSGTLTDYSWATSMMLTDGVTRQALTSDNGAGFTASTLGAGNLISDSTVGNVRTSSYSVTGFPTLRVTLTQTAANAGITQQYLFTNMGATALNLTAVSFHDVDLDGATFLNDTVFASGGKLSVTEGGRTVGFSSSPLGYQGFLAGFVPGGGVTGSLDTFVWNNFGIPAGNLNSFRDVNGGVLNGNLDANNDGVSDAVMDVGYAFQNVFSIPAGGSATMTLTTVPEPSAALLGVLALGALGRRRR